MSSFFNVAKVAIAISKSSLIADTVWPTSIYITAGGTE